MRRIVIANIALLIGSAIVYATLLRQQFNEPMTITKSLYFSVCTQSTVGFGDVHPTANMARLVVAAHIVLTLYTNIAYALSP